jgi:hypothetical protein
MIEVATLRDRPVYRLTRHFLGSLFEFDVLSDVGAESFKRLIVGICVVFLSFGLVLARVALIKYANLSAGDDPTRLFFVLLSDEAFFLGLPMWVAAFVTVLAGHGVFPDERDFRILMVLPVTKRLVFGTKVAALTLFTGLFVLAVHAALTPMLLMYFWARLSGFAAILNIVSFAVATTAASAFGVLAVIAMNGILMLTAPRDRLLSASAAFRSLMLAALVVTFPFVWRLSGMARAFARESEWLYLIPPAWFVGFDQALAGDASPFFLRLVIIGAAALAIAVLLAVASYAVLYRHFDRVMVRPTDGKPPRTDRAENGRYLAYPRPRSRPALQAIQRFTFITLRRSVLHQGVVVTLGAMGLGYIVNRLVSAGGIEWAVQRSLPEPLETMRATVIWAPFPLIFALSAAVRIGLSVPIEQRANWIFRMTEQETTRVDQLRAAVRAMVVLGVSAPIVAMLPLQWLLLGPQALVAGGVTWIVGVLFAELLMKEWARIPFTCSYIPGKGFVPQMLLTAFVSFVLLTTLGSALVAFALAVGREAIVPIAIVCGFVLWLQRRRLRRWRDTPLVFEDVLPTEVNPLQLS